MGRGDAHGPSCSVGRDLLAATQHGSCGLGVEIHGAWGVVTWRLGASLVGREHQGTRSHHTGVPPVPNLLVMATYHVDLLSGCLVTVKMGFLKMGTPRNEWFMTIND